MEATIHRMGSSLNFRMDSNCWLQLFLGSQLHFRKIVYVFTKYDLLCYIKPFDLRRRYGISRLLGLRVRIAPVTWMSVCCECWILLCKRSLSRADNSSRGFLPSVVYLSMIVKTR